jgi:hypothetical protein
VAPGETTTTTTPLFQLRLNPSLLPTCGVQIRWIDTIQLFDMNDIKSKFLKNLIPVFR